MSNGGTSKVSELELKSPSGIILGERENIVSGIDGSFTLNLQPGHYTLSCPNGDQEDNGRLVVSGKAVAVPAADAAALAAATAGYKSYVEGESTKLLASTRQFVAALEAGDLAQAKALFGPARSHYEAIEPVAESFGDLDPEIDARAGDVPAASWTGFHRIEQILWQKNTTAGTAGYAKKLLADVTTLDTKVKTLSYQAPQLANGAVELLNEVAGSKITGEEDRYSHTDLSDFAANVEGAQAGVHPSRPGARGSGRGRPREDDRSALRRRHGRSRPLPPVDPARVRDLQRAHSRRPPGVRSGGRRARRAPVDDRGQGFRLTPCPTADQPEELPARGRWRRRGARGGSRRRRVSPGRARW